MRQCDGGYRCSQVNISLSFFQGQFRDLICDRCNRLKVVQRELIAYSHNGTGYDHAIVFEALMKDEKLVRSVYNVVCDSGDRYLSISLKFFCDDCIKVGRNCSTMDDDNKKKQSNVRMANTQSNDGNDTMNSQNMLTSNREDVREERISSDPKYASLDERIIMEMERNEGAMVEEEEEEEEEEEAEGELVEEEEEAAVRAGGRSIVKKNCSRKIPPPPTCFCKDILGLKLLDSAKLLCGSLESLADNLYSTCKPDFCAKCTPDHSCQLCSELKEKNEVFFHTHKMVKSVHNDENMMNLYTGKSKFPHDYINGVHSLEVTSLPGEEYFFSSLTNCGISPNEYQQCLDRWNQLNCKNLKDYMVAYLRSDITILW